MFPLLGLNPKTRWKKFPLFLRFFYGSEIKTLTYDRLNTKRKLQKKYVINYVVAFPIMRVYIKKYANVFYHWRFTWMIFFYRSEHVNCHRWIWLENVILGDLRKNWEKCAKSLSFVSSGFKIYERKFVFFFRYKFTINYLQHRR